MGIVNRPARFASVEELLAHARTGLDRLDPHQAAAAVAAGAQLVDILPVRQRTAMGEVPGSLIIERNHLEWRLHPDSDARVPAARPGQHWIVLCAQGYTSSLAAAALLSLGIPASDLAGGFQAWIEAGLPTTPGPTPVEQYVRG